MDHEQYAPLAKMYKLPAHETLEREFDLLAIPKECAYPMKELAKKIFERIDLFRKTLETLASPELLVDMHESETLTEVEKTDVSDLLRELMLLDRALLQAELDNSDAAYAAWVSAASAKWLALKPRIAPILKKMHTSWNGSARVREQLHYLG